MEESQILKMIEIGKIECEFVPLKGQIKSMIATLPTKWTSYKISFFYRRLHEENSLPTFPKYPKFYIGGKHFEEHQTLSSHITEVRLKFSDAIRQLKSREK